MTTEREYEVWAGGARLHEGAYQPSFLGRTTASSFREACEKVRDAHSRDDTERDRWDLDAMTYWGCDLFQDKKAAWFDYVEHYID